jgi:hypothetical protein
MLLYGACGRKGGFAAIYSVAEALAAEYGQSITPRTVRSYLPQAHVKLMKVRNDKSKFNVASHFCAWTYKLMRRLGQLFSKETNVLSIDAMRLINLGTEDFNKQRGAYQVSPCMSA